MTPHLRIACEQAGRQAVDVTAKNLLLQVAMMDGARFEVRRRLLVVLEASLTAWLRGSASEGLDPNLVEIAATDLEAMEGWAAWLGTGLSADVSLRDAMANEIRSAIEAVQDAG